MVLRPVIVVLGGVRVYGRPERKMRQKSRRRSRRDRAPVLEMNVHDKTVVNKPDQWRAARRFAKNSNDLLRSYYVRTPLGHIALKSNAGVFRKFREHAMMEAVRQHNGHHDEWQVLVELTWAELGEDGRSMLLTLMKEDLPESYFEPPGEAVA